MPSTRKQKAKARKSRELDMLSDYGNMDVMLGEGKSNSIERELDSLINVPERQQDLQSFPNRENSSQEKEIRDIDSRNELVRESRLVESINMLSGEMNARMSREMETMMDLMHSQISEAISSAISERIIPEIQNMVENLPLSQHGVEPCTSTNEGGIRNVWKNANTKLTKKDSRYACDLRDHVDNVPYNIYSYIRMFFLSECFFYSCFFSEFDCTLIFRRYSFRRHSRGTFKTWYIGDGQKSGRESRR